ncbi:hypothetical protein [Staphylococcus pseudintermedius]|uniref:hypothetical protein n=1 Tax=Staphylococcus pseudintermedius TaxID=283734 RepID=UPI00193481EA|nr:hypothetical protein [Staphylococcus pseudintermedius]MBM0287819.1 hypothetical protein [Staphylococcus pseudintermedius]
MKFNQKFTIGEKVKITDIDNYKGYTGYYDVPELQDEYLKNTVFTIIDEEVIYKEFDASDEPFDVKQFELMDNKGYKLALMIDDWALVKSEKE